MKTINKVKILTEDEFPRTRRQLLYALWYNKKLDLPHRKVNVFKEGAAWTIHINGFHATYIRRLDNLNIKSWAQRVKACMELETTESSL